MDSETIVRTLHESLDLVEKTKYSEAEIELKNLSSLI